MKELAWSHIATTVLRNGQTAYIRPLEEADRFELLQFAHTLPQDDLLYLEDDFLNPDIISRLINARFASNWRQCVATIDNRIVGYAAVRQLPGWSNHVGRIILLVGSEWRRCGVGNALAYSIFEAARDLGVSKVVVEMLERQAAGRAIFERLGFTLEGRLVAHARDRAGRDHNLNILAYYVDSLNSDSTTTGFNPVQ
jgi:RimJ/RimL family protein N-acetyltransferase